MHDPSTDGADHTQVVLGPGDILYIPSGRPHRATGGDSLRMVIAVQQPTARDLTELVLAGFLRSARATEIAGTHHTMSLDEKVAWLRTELAAYLAGQDLDALVGEAVKIRQRVGRVRG